HLGQAPVERDARHAGAVLVLVVVADAPVLFGGVLIVRGEGRLDERVWAVYAGVQDAHARRGLRRQHELLDHVVGEVRVLAGAQVQVVAGEVLRLSQLADHRHQVHGRRDLLRRGPRVDHDPLREGDVPRAYRGDADDPGDFGEATMHVVRLGTAAVQ